MNTWLVIDSVAFLLVVLLTGVLIPQILLVAFRKQLFDTSDERKIHKVAVSRLGGIAFFSVILFTMLLVFSIGRTYFADAVDSVPGDSITNLCFISCAVVTLYLVGMADDLIGIKYRAKFVVQVFTAILLIVGGIELTDLHAFLGIHIMPAAVSVALTILLAVFIANAINLIDGLVSGLSAIACASYTVIFYKAGRGPFLPDKTHIHHKLLALGMSQHVAMPTIVAASLLLTLTNYVLSKHLNITLLFFLDLTVWIMVNSSPLPSVAANSASTAPSTNDNGLCA